MMLAGEAMPSAALMVQATIAMPQLSRERRSRKRRARLSAADASS